MRKVVESEFPKGYRLFSVENSNYHLSLCPFEGTDAAIFLHMQGGVCTICDVKECSSDEEAITWFLEKLTQQEKH